MCLIAVAPRGTDKYDSYFLDGIEESSIVNRDGIGFAFKSHKTNKVRMVKGFTTYKGFLAAYKTHSIHEMDDVVVHLRKANKGHINEHMCHPFKMEAPNSLLLGESNHPCFGETTKAIMFHNGTIEDYYKLADPAKSDSYNFAREFMGVPEIQNLLKRSPEDFAKVFSHTIKLCRFAFMFPGDDSETILLGEYNESEGYSFSNYTWESYFQKIKREDKERPVRPNYNKFYNREQDDEYDWREHDFTPSQAPFPRSPLIVPIGQSLKEDFEDSNEITEDTEDNLPLLISSKVNEINYKDFNLIARAGCSIAHPNIFEGRSYTISYWKSMLVHNTQTLISKPVDGKISYYDVAIENIQSCFYLIAKPQYKQRHDDLSVLKTTLGIPSKNLMKKLKPICTIRLATIKDSQIYCGEMEDKMDKYAVAYFYLQHLHILYKSNIKQIQADIILVKACIEAAELLDVKPSVLKLLTP